MSSLKIENGEELVQSSTCRLSCRLPTGGAKALQPCGSWLEQRQLQAALEHRKELLQVQRVERYGVLSVARWEPGEARAVVERQSGAHWRWAGRRARGRLTLGPHEALFLLEAGVLRLRLGGCTLSLQAARALLLPDTESAAVYSAYAALARVGRHVTWHMASVSHVPVPPPVPDSDEGVTKLEEVASRVSEEDGGATASPAPPSPAPPGPPTPAGEMHESGNEPFRKVSKRNNLSFDVIPELLAARGMEGPVAVPTPPPHLLPPGVGPLRPLYLLHASCTLATSPAASPAAPLSATTTPQPLHYTQDVFPFRRQSHPFSFHYIFRSPFCAFNKNVNSFPSPRVRRAESRAARRALRDQIESLAGRMRRLSRSGDRALHNRAALERLLRAYNDTHNARLQLDARLRVVDTVRTVELDRPDVEVARPRRLAALGSLAERARRAGGGHRLRRALFAAVRAYNGAYGTHVRLGADCQVLHDDEIEVHSSESNGDSDGDGQRVEDVEGSAWGGGRRGEGGEDAGDFGGPEPGRARSREARLADAHVYSYVRATGDRCRSWAEGKRAVRAALGRLRAGAEREGRAREGRRAAVREAGVDRVTPSPSTHVLVYQSAHRCVRGEALVVGPGGVQVVTKVAGGAVAYLHAARVSHNTPPLTPLRDHSNEDSITD